MSTPPNIGFIKPGEKRGEKMGRVNKHGTAVDGRTITAENVMIPKITRQPGSLSYKLKLG